MSRARERFRSVLSGSTCVLAANHLRSFIGTDR